MTTVRGRTPLALPNRAICGREGRGGEGRSAGAAVLTGCRRRKQTKRHQGRHGGGVASLPHGRMGCNMHASSKKAGRRAARELCSSAPSAPTRAAISSTSSVSHPSLLANARASFSAAASRGGKTSTVGWGKRALAKPRALPSAAGREGGARPGVSASRGAPTPKVAPAVKPPTALAQLRAPQRRNAPRHARYAAEARSDETICGTIVQLFN